MRIELSGLLRFLALCVAVSVAMPAGAAEWQESTPAAQGLDASRFDALRAQLATGTPFVRSVVVVRNDRIVFEYLRAGVARDEPQQVASVTKSVVGALIGIAIERRQLQLDQTLGELLPQANAPDIDARVRAITVRHLLTLTAGFDWDERVADECRFNRSPGCERFDTKGDPVGYALRRPLADAPGTKFRYDSWSSHLLSVILTRVTGMSAAQFAQRELAEPMGLGRLTWFADRQGNNYGGFGIAASTRDMARFGSLFLHEGRWEGRQLVPADYVRSATQQQVQGGWPLGPWAGYGYHWWILQLPGGGLAYSGIGFGGQYVYVVPSLNVVLAMSSDTRPGQDTSVLFRDFIMPALLGAR